MEVSGRRDYYDGSSSSSTAEGSQLLCQPCCGEGQNVTAEGFCQNCKEYLCVTCITHHRKVTLSKHHVILDKHNMPTNKQQQVAKPTCTEVCEKHSAEFVKFYCKEHEVVGCGDCMVLGHKSCKVDYIPDIAENFVSGDEFSSLVKGIERLISVVKDTKEKIAKDEKDVAKAYVETVKDIKEFRKEADAYINRMELELLAQCEKMRKDNDLLIQKTTDDCKKSENQLGGIRAQLTSKEEQPTSLFVKANKAAQLIKEMEQKRLAVESKSKLQMGKFKRSVAISDMISKCSPLGEIETSDIFQHHIKSAVDWIPKQQGSINVKSSSDSRKCLISGIVAINEGKLACTDWFNKKVKLIDVKRAVVKKEISLSDPWDLTCVPDDQLAVTLVNSKQIQLLSFRGGLSKRRVISVSGKCRGITYSKDRLIVSYEIGPDVEIMTLEGKVLQCIKNDSTGNALFSNPLYVAVSSDASFIYVSDSGADSVIKLSFDGQDLATYNDRKLHYPRKLIVCKDGSVLVYSCNGNSVHLISSDCKQLKILLESKDGVGECWGLCYSDDNNTLYMSNNDGKNQILTYKMA